MSAETTAVLIVGDWRTQCSNCGKDCDASETHHKTVLPGFARREATEGCGALFVAMRPSPSARIVPGMKPCGYIADLRPDLPVAAVSR